MRFELTPKGSIDAFCTTEAWGGEERKVLSVFPVADSWMVEDMTKLPTNLESAQEVIGTINGLFAYIKEERYLDNVK